MTPYYEQDGITIYHGDCREVVPSIGLSVATLICDPPYGLSFMGKGWDHGVPDAETWLSFHSSLLPGSMMLAFGGTRTWHRLACAIEDGGYEIRDTLMWLYGSGFPKSLDISKAIDKAAGVEREVVGISTRGCNPNYKCSSADSKNIEITNPETPAAKLWQGYGTALKPAWEPIILAMKRCEGTFAENAQKHCVAGLNVDGGRIGTEKITTTGHTGDKYAKFKGWKQGEPLSFGSHVGRFPANLLMDEQAAALLDEQSGELKSPATYERNSPNRTGAVVYGKYGPEAIQKGHGDSGGASRFFYVAKASNSDRGNVKAGPLPLFGEGDHEERNEHPTVKPTSLMRYLCRITRTPTGGLVLDPFMGSGSTLIAAKAEGRPAVGIEIEERYCEIAAKRLSQTVIQFQEGR